MRYHRDLRQLCTNFVSFKDFYDGGEPAIFQAGTLYLDQRACELCLRVDDAAKHAAMAGLAGAYLAYLDCARKATGEKMQIVAAFTAGDSDNLMVGRNGLFYDRQGRDWDATITKIVDNPISIRQAFWSPYKKFVRLLEEQVAKRAAAADARVAHDAERRPPPRPRTSAAPSAPEAKKIDVGTVAALGVAVGRHRHVLHRDRRLRHGLFKLGLLATARRDRRRHAAHLAALGGAGVHQAAQAQPGADPGRQRVGGERRAKINVPFGATLTGVAKLPRGSRRDTAIRTPRRASRGRRRCCGAAGLRRLLLVRRRAGPGASRARAFDRGPRQLGAGPPAAAVATSGRLQDRRALSVRNARP